MASRPSRKKRRTSRGPSFPRGIVPGVWLLALLALVGLIYWGRSAKPEQPQAPTATQERKPAAAKAFDHREPVRTKEAARPQTAVQHDPAPSQEAGEKQRSEPRQLAASDRPMGDRGGKPGNLHSALEPQAGSREPSAPTPLPDHPPLTPPLARAAIVIDDFGPSLEVAKSFLEVPLSLTFSVLPHQRYSQEIAALAHQGHRQVILHLPMEPRGFPKVSPGKGALLLAMSDTAIQQSLRTALDCSPYFVGINNHMGSRFTESAAVMKTVLQEAHKHQLFFVDSYTSPRSVASQVAHEIQIPFRRRDIFLDNNQSESAIRSQLKQVRRRAAIQGTVLAIGHPHEATLRALRQEAEAFEREKIAVVPASELMPGAGDDRF